MDLRSAIKQNSLSEKWGNIGLQRELTKLYKPITESQSTITREIDALKESTSSAQQALPAAISSQLKAITPPSYPSILAETAEEEAASRQQSGLIELGPLASSYLKRSMSNKQSTDRTCGLYEKDNTFFIGDKAVTISPLEQPSTEALKDYGS